MPIFPLHIVQQKYQLSWLSVENARVFTFTMLKKEEKEKDGYLQARRFENGNQVKNTVHVQWKSKSLAENFRWSTCALPCVEPWSSPNFHRCHITGNVENNLQMGSARRSLVSSNFQWNNSETAKSLYRQGGHKIRQPRPLQRNFFHAHLHVYQNHACMEEESWTLSWEPRDHLKHKITVKKKEKKILIKHLKNLIIIFELTDEGCLLDQEIHNNREHGTASMRLAGAHDHDPMSHQKLFPPNLDRKDSMRAPPKSSLRSDKRVLQFQMTKARPMDIDILARRWRLLFYQMDKQSLACE